MGNTDSIPIVSQAKSTVQLVCGDTDGAARTQENFFRECPGVSQVTSVVQVLAGDTDGAIETQKRCGKGLMKAADGIPIVGHAKGVIHYACGDTEGGNQAMKSATRTTGVLAGGAGGFLIGGPAGAIGGGIYGGTVMDVGTSIVTKESTGYIAAIENAVKNPNPGDIFDLALMPVSDGLAGYGAGKIVQKTLASSAQAVDMKAGKALEAKGVALYEQMEAKLEANPNMPTGEYVNGMRKSQNMVNMGRAMQGETMSYPTDAMKPKPGSGATATAFVPNSKTKGKESQEEEYEAKRRQRQRYSEKTEYEQQSRTYPTHQWRQKQRYRTGSDDSDSEEEECICTHVTIPVLYVNICSINYNNKTSSMNEKIRRLKALINIHQPRIIAFVESWLTKDDDDPEIRAFLGLGAEYELIRQNRRVGLNQPNAYCESGGENNRRGGGILMAWRKTDPKRPMTEIFMERNTAEDYGDNIVNFDITATYSCKKCCRRGVEMFMFTVVYRRPSAYPDQSRDEYGLVDKLVVNRLIHITTLYKEPLLKYSEGVMVGDFNWKDKNVVGEFLDRTESEIVAMSRSQTHVGGNALDQVIASYGFVTSPYDINTSLVEVTDPVSDHSALVFNLKLGKDIPERSECKAKRCSPRS